MTVDQVFQRVLTLSAKSGFTGTISSVNFNQNFPFAERRYYQKLYGNQNEYRYGDPVPRIAYPSTIKVSSSLSKFSSAPQILTIDANGHAPKPTDLFFVDSLSHIMYENGGAINGSITAGTAYTNGVYTGIPLTGGSGTGAIATITIAGNLVTQVRVTTNGTGYKPGDTLSALAANIGGTGSGFSYYVLSVGTTPTAVRRVEKQDLADNLFSYYEYPTEMFPIYVEYEDYFQFYPTTLISATLTYLMNPTTCYWGYTLNGTISTTNTLVGGSGYTNGTYPNVNFTGGAGNSASGTVVVSGGVVTSVTITNGGFQYKVGDTLTGTLPVGAGWSFKVASITNARQVYDSATSVDPIWLDIDIDNIIYMFLTDMGAFLKDSELEGYATANSRNGGIS